MISTYAWLFSISEWSYPLSLQKCKHLPEHFLLKPGLSKVATLVFRSFVQIYFIKSLDSFYIPSNCRIFSESPDEKSTNVIITPAVYLRYIHTLRDNYVEQSGHIEERKNRLEKLLQKLEAISVQVFLYKY